MFHFTRNFSSGTRNVVKNISSEIVRECLKQGVTVSPDVASLGVILLCLDPDHGLSLTSQNDRSVLENFVRHCVQSFLNEQSPLVKTLEMQVYFMVNTIDPERVLKKYQANIDEKAQPLWKEIVEVENPNKEEQEKLFKKIMIYINMVYLLGSSTNTKVLTETSHALKSVMSKADITDFFVLKKKARAKHLKAVQEVVCGIRVFNKDAGHCGEGIRDIQADLQYAYENTKTALSEKIETIEGRIKKLTNFLYSLVEIDSEEDTLRLVLPEDFTENNFQYLKGMLVLCLQHELYVKNLLKTLGQIKSEIDQQLDEFRKVLDVLHDIVQYRTAVPTEKVFPHFTQVSIIWQSMLNYIYLLIEINKVNEHLSVLTDMRSCEKLLHRYESKHVIRKYPKETAITSQALSNEMNKFRLSYVTAHQQTAANATPISKFCPYIFTIGDGLLLPSRTNAGFIKHEEILLSFSKTENSRKFLSNINDFFPRFIRVIQKHPEVVLFFDIYDMASTFRISDERKVDDMASISQRVECEMQTELHPIPYYKDKNYTWNIWDLRRKAIKLANLKNCRTHSAQTDLSYNRMNVCLQTADPKENECQTKCDAYTNIVKHDASTECSEDDNVIGVRALASSGVVTVAPIKDYYTVPYRLGTKKRPDKA